MADMQFFKDDGVNDPTPIPEAFFDGYSVGDTLLEGVIFRCTIVGDKIAVRVTDDCAKYFSGLNEAKWLKEVSEAVNDPDCDSFLADERGTVDAYLERGDG